MSETQVWKSTLLFTDEQEIMVPEGAQILHAGPQGDEMCVWYRCDPNKPKRLRQIRIAGTGHPISDAPWRYIATCFLRGQTLVFHIFEREQ